MYWSDSGELVCLASDESYFILKYNAEAVQVAMSTNQGIDEDGVEAGLEVCVCLYVHTPSHPHTLTPSRPHTLPPHGRCQERWMRW